MDKYQEAIVPVNVGHYRTNNNEAWTLGDCPKCGYRDLNSKSDKKCPKCKIKLDWSGDNK